MTHGDPNTNATVPVADGSAYIDTSTGTVYTATTASNTGGTQWNQIGSLPQWTTGMATGITGTSTTFSYGSNVVVTPACPLGHRADTNYAEYIDGEIATTCLECGDRITFVALPGGVPLLRLKALMERIMSDDKSGALEDYAVVMAALEMERLALEAAESLAALARTLLEK